MKPLDFKRALTPLLFALLPVIFGSCSEKPNPTSVPTGTNNIAPSDTVLALPDTVDFGPWGVSYTFIVTSTPLSTFNWTIEMDSGFLLAYPGLGASGDTVTLSVDRTDSSLAWGENIRILWLGTDRDSLDGKQIVVRVVKDSNAPRLYIPPMSASTFGMDRDTILFSIHNTGKDSLEWTIDASSSWLRINPASGTNWSFVILSIDRSSLQGGLYRDTVVISSNGGDTALPVSLIVPSDTSTRRFLEYWPFHTGNSWVWINPEQTYWWALAVTDSFMVDTFPVWKIRGDDAQGGHQDYFFTFANGKLTVVFDSLELFDLNSVTYADCQSTLAQCWSDGNTFAIINDDIKPGDTYDPYWDVNSEYIPGSLSGLMGYCTIWSNEHITFADLPTGDINDCMGLRDKATPANELYTIFAKGFGPVIWDGYGLAYATINGVEYGAVPQNLQSLHFAINADTTSDLLYWFSDNNASHVYFMGYRHNGMPIPTHILFEDSLGQPYGTILLRADFQPVMWIMDTLTIGVHNINANDSTATDTAYDPTNAYHIMLTNDQQMDFYADIYPHDPYGVLDTLELYLDTWLTHVRDLFDSVGIQSYEDLIAAGYIKGPNQERWQAIASFVSIGAALIAYEVRDTTLGKARLAKMLPGGVFIPDPVKDMAKKTFGYFQDELACKYCIAPNVPSVTMLQCQGLKAVVWSGQVCHNSFMGNTSASRCVNLCQVSTKCFTNICMPRSVAVSDVQNVLWENNQAVTPEEIKDLVKQNIDNLSPILSIGN